jgi:hypothetical protein
MAWPAEKASPHTKRNTALSTFPTSTTLFFRSLSDNMTTEVALETTMVCVHPSFRSQAKVGRVLLSSNCTKTTLPRPAETFHNSHNEAITTTQYSTESYPTL